LTKPDFSWALLNAEKITIGTVAPSFKNTSGLFEAGDSLDVFLDHFPSVSRESAIALVRLSKGHSGV